MSGRPTGPARKVWNPPQTMPKGEAKLDLNPRRSHAIGTPSLALMSTTHVVHTAPYRVEKPLLLSITTWTLPLCS